MKGTMGVRTDRESNRRREVADLLVLRRAYRMAQASAEKLKHTGPAEKERVVSVPQREQLASTPEPPFPKGTEPSVQSTRSQGERESHLGEREGSEREHGEERMNATVKEGWFQEGEGEQASRASLEQVEKSMSGRKSSPGQSAESWFHSKSGQT